MGLLDWIGNAAGTKAMQAGSDVLITKHTVIDALQIPEQWRATADHVIKQRFTAQQDIHTEFDAALVKLSIYWTIAESVSHADGMELFGHCIDQLRDAAPAPFTPAISLEVMGNTGH